MSVPALPEKHAAAPDEGEMPGDSGRPTSTGGAALTDFVPVAAATSDRKQKKPAGRLDQKTLKIESTLVAHLNAERSEHESEKGGEPRTWVSYTLARKRPESFKPSTTHIHGRESMSGRRLEQLLKHTSTALLEVARSKESDPVEVQSMFVDGRLLIAGNKGEGVAKLAEFLRTKGLATAAQTALAQIDQDRPDDVHQHRHIRKFGKVAASGEVRHKSEAAAALAGADDSACRDAVQASELASLLAAARDAKLVMTGGANDAEAFLRSDKHRGRVMVLTGGNLPHAEQQLVKVLWKSKVTSLATIQGVRRTCVGCFLTLAYARDHMRLPLRFSEEPGLAYPEAFKGLERVVADHVRELMRIQEIDSQGFLDDVLQQLGRMLPDTHHVTPIADRIDEALSTLSDSEDEGDSEKKGARKLDMGPSLFD